MKRISMVLTLAVFVTFVFSALLAILTHLQILMSLLKNYLILSKRIMVIKRFRVYIKM